MKARFAGFALVLIAAGCGGTKLVDPCAGQKGTCLAIQIEGSSTVSRIGGARVHVTGDALDYSQTVALTGGGSSTALPVALAVLFPTAPPTTAIQVDIVGTSGGVDVGEGKTSATLTAGAHAKVNVTLGHLTGDDGGAPSEGDAGPADLSLTGDLIGYAPLTVQLAGSGTGSISATGLTCSGTTCSGVYPVHSMVTLGAVPATNATFGGWNGGGCVGTGSCVVTLDQSTTVTATFNWLFVPSHVSASAYKTNAGNLSGVTAIDTTALTINGAAPPTGVTFAIDNGIAVLSIGTWNITTTVTVTGNAPLAVIAAGSVVLSGNAALHADANLATPGPGGNAPCSATGAGHDATSTQDPGGGNFGGGAAGPPDAGAAGATYGGLLTDFCGGGHGGAGTASTGGTSCPTAVGGAGGGAIQISSAVSILVESSTISASGGGGTGECDITFTSPSSRAGLSAAGAGGEIFLEAPTVSVTDPSAAHTGLFANGGGGGGAATSKGTGTGVVTTSGTNGVNGQDAQSAAAGGTSSGGNGAYSADGVLLTPATSGGGGVGRIWLRTRGTPATVSAELSPAPSVDTTL